ncbi:MAG: hypothetical protein K5679_06010 [Lachnospiraceae bacterium]|nr:hypothetical protein [Lachnospiraceae bacterium]
MRKSNTGRIIAMIVLTLGFLILMFGFVLSPKNTRKTHLNVGVIVENGEAAYRDFKGKFNIERPGKYDITVEWMPDEDAGFISGFALYDLDRSVTAFCTGQQVRAGFLPIRLEKAEYEFEIRIFASEEELNEFLSSCDNDCTVSGDRFTGYKDGAWTVDYTVTATLSSKWMLLIFTVGCAMYALLMALLIFRMCHEGKPEYDERKKLVNGKAYEYGFYTMLVLSVIYVLAWFMGIADEFLSPGVAVMLITLIVAAVVGIYNVINDGYIAVNAYEGRVIASLSAILAVNILATIGGIRTGSLIKDGKLGISSVNAFCGLLMLALIVAILIRKARSKKENDDEELEA